MRTFERTLLLALALAVLARVTLDPEAHARADRDDQHFQLAVCAMPSLVNELMASDRFLPDREDAAPDIRRQLDELREELQDLEERIRGGAGDDPSLQRDRERAREAVREFQSLQQSLARAIETKTAEQLAECYALVKSSASAIAEELGFDYVIATGDPDERLSTADSQVTLRQITARPVLRFPKGVDITDDVRDDLNLE